MIYQVCVNVGDSEKQKITGKITTHTGKYTF